MTIRVTQTCDSCKKSRGISRDTLPTYYNWVVMPNDMDLCPKCIESLLAVTKEKTDE